MDPRHLQDQVAPVSHDFLGVLEDPAFRQILVDPLGPEGLGLYFHNRRQRNQIFQPGDEKVIVVIKGLS